jgi:hypothetical protein
MPLIVVAFLAPESPWWLVRKGRIADARKSLERLTSKSSGVEDFDLDNTISMMAHTNELEKEVSGAGLHASVQVRASHVVLFSTSAPLTSSSSAPVSARVVTRRL